MKVFVYESDNTLIGLFQKPEYLVPFLSSNLLSILEVMFKRYDQECQIFLPESWGPHSGFYSYSGDIFAQLEKHQKNEYELIFITGLFSVMFNDLEDSDISYLKQNPERLYVSGGVVGGYLKRGQHLPRPEDFDGFKNFTYLDETNYIKLSQDMIGKIDLESVSTPAKIYGKPVILSKNISEDSVVCGPCFVGEYVTVRSSQILPGTVILGTSEIVDSKLFSSFVLSSQVSHSSLENAMIIESVCGGLKLSGGKLPPGSEVVNEQAL